MNSRPSRPDTQSRRTSQSDVLIKKTKKVEAVICGEGPNLVFPDMQDLGKALELVRLRWMHFCRKTVQAVLIAVDQLGISAGLGKYRVLLVHHLRRKALNLRAGFVETNTRHTG